MNEPRSKLAELALRLPGRVADERMLEKIGRFGRDPATID